jgi:hypothetical protein
MKENKITNYLIQEALAQASIQDLTQQRFNKGFGVLMHDCLIVPALQKMKKYPLLALNDYKDKTLDYIKTDMAMEFGGLYGDGNSERANDWIESNLKDYNILIAMMNNGGYDSSCYFLLMHKKTKTLYEVEASHCSCYGYEDCWDPIEASPDSILMRKYNMEDLNNYIKTHFKRQIKNKELV